MIARRPEPSGALKARYPAAVAETYDHRDPATRTTNRPAKKRQHVFDFDDGLRLIVSRERMADGREGIHVSASLHPDTPLYAAGVARGRGGPSWLEEIASERFAWLSGAALGPLDWLGRSDGKGVPHWWRPLP